jgi:hypothetical protein
MEKFGAIALFLIVCAAWGYSRKNSIMACVTGHTTGVKK